MRLLRLKRTVLYAGLFLAGLILLMLFSSHLAPAYPDSLSLNRSDREILSARVAEIEQTWLGHYEDYFRAGSTVPLLTAEQITTTLGRLTGETGKKLALIYVFPHPEELELMLVIPDAPLMRQTLPNVSGRTLQEVVAAFKSQSIRPASGRRYSASARQLYRWIIAPLESELQANAIDTLVFCAGEGLRSLPFAALWNGEQFLIEKYNLGLVPAFSLTNATHNKLRDSKILAMGASEFQNLEALPAVPLELSAIMQNVWQGEIFLNQDFTLDNLRQQLNSEGFGIVHLATHAEFRPGVPTNSFIQLWQSDRLTLDQVQQLDWSTLPVDLLVLSACQTALGDRQAELGFAGLTFHAGVKSSLASLWRISDLGTMALMREFYWQLANPEVETKAEALRNAQIALLTGKVYVENGQLHTSSGDLPLPANLEESGQFNFSSPYYWAAFTLVGSPW